MSNPGLLVVLIARRPEHGRVKTRLAATLGSAEALRIYTVLANDVNDTLLAAREQGVIDVAIGLTPNDYATDDGRWLAGAAHRWPQGGGDLGARLRRLFTRGFEAGYQRVLAVGPDIVGLDVKRFADLNTEWTQDTLIAPTPDGGYGLVGSTRAAWPRAERALFIDMPWSTEAVAHATRERTYAAGLSCHEIDGLADVDVEADLEGVLPTLAVLVPVLDEAPRLRRLLTPLMQQARAAAAEVEVIVADGGSSDGSAELARELGAKVIQTERGRGLQLRAAASHARARWLWTVHADARIEADAVEAVLRTCQRPDIDWAACPSRFDHPSPFLRLLECLTDGRPRVFRMPYGDQGLLVRRSAYESAGGYPAIALMEDVELATRLRAFRGPARISTRLTVDARRWRRFGMLGTTLRNLWTLFRYRSLGVDAATLAAGYRRGEEPSAGEDTLGA